MMGDISFKTNLWHSLIFLSLVFGLYGCEDSGRSLNELASGPKFDPKITGIAEELSENRRQNLADTLPPNLVPLDGEAGILNVNSNPFSTAVVLSDSPVPIEWTTSIDGGPGGGIGIFLRWSNRPLVSDCPIDGTPLSDGVRALNLADGIDHSLRRHYTRENGRTDWDLSDPAFEDLGRYYFQGCLVRNFTGEFIGIGTNVVEAEIVDRLPDLVIHQAYIFNSGPRRGELFIWVLDAVFRSDIRGDVFRYEVVGRRIGDPSFEVSHRGTTALNLGSGAFIDLLESDFELPDDGHQYEVTVRINTDVPRLISESNYDNNVETLIWQVNKPAIFAINSLYVRENCDQRSPGEWALDGLITRDSVNRWPLESASSGYFDTEDNTRYPADPDRKGLLILKITNLPLDEPLTVNIGFYDCNHLFGGCGEEWREHPFGGARPSVAGYARATLTPENRMRGDFIEVDSTDGNCGENAFTATYRLMNPDRARAEGYEVDYTLPPR